ncbi:MAG: undecaprenyl-diphosphate phosphatase [Eubacteriales bacterium]|nr:undecaprenyl-diphosphate phosphatase [Eubacteriales bacterium]
MSVLYSIFLGIVQGITEFLPVSSSGHLAILKNLLGIQMDNGLLFDVLLHLGTVIAIICVFRKDIWRMIRETVHMIADIVYNIKTRIHNQKEQDAKRYRKVVHNNYRKFVVLILVSTVPTAVIGYTARELVSIAEQTLIVPGICLILTAIFLIVADVTEPGKKIPRDVSYTSGFMIGVAQGLSTLPGLSRSGMTIASCLMCGFERRFAVKYSFIMSIPAILGAAVLEIHESIGTNLAFTQVLIYLLGAAAAGIAGYICIKKMLVIVRKKKFKGFAVYCLVLGIISITGYFLQR